MLEITVPDPGRLLEQLDEFDRTLAAAAADRERVDALLDEDARELPDTDLVRAVDAAVRSGEAPRSVRALADRVARLDLSWDDLLDLPRPPRDADVAAARSDLVATGMDRLRGLDPRVDLEAGPTDDVERGRPAPSPW